MGSGRRISNAGEPSPGMRDAAGIGMDRLNRILILHQRLARLVWLALLLVLVACNDGNSGGDGGY